MQCYNRNCREECDDFKIKYCIFKRTKEQLDLMIQYGCKYCGSREIDILYGKKKAKLCTFCGRIRRGKEILNICIIDNGRAK